MNLLLIAGHGAGDPGAVSGSRKEADETRKVVSALSSALTGYCGVKQYPTGRNAYTDYQSGSLGATANFPAHDVVLEVHFNAVSKSASDGKTKGVECYVPTTETRATLANSICRNIAAVGLTNRGVKKYNWAVISAAKRAGVLAMLLEVCFIDDPDDMLVYTEKFQSIVNAIASAVIGAYGLKKEEPAVSYEQFVEFMDRYEQERAARQPSAWSAAARKWAEANGVVNGNEKGQMRYQSPVTREELVQVLYGMNNPK